MKRCLIPCSITLFLLSAFAGFAPAAHARSCSTARTAGNYGFTLTGALTPPTGPVWVAAVGQASLDSDGNVSGTEARSLGGSFANETFTGTFSVNPDCTGTTTLNFYEAGQLVRTSVLSIVVDNSNHEVRMVQQSLTLPNGASIPVVITVEARRIQRDDDE